jgi:hypothetical protein
VTIAFAQKKRVQINFVYDDQTEQWNEIKKKKMRKREEKKQCLGL